MKKKIIIPLVLATLVGTAVIGVSANADNAVYSKKHTNTSNVSSEITTNDATNSTMNDSTSTQGISKEEAKAIAFKHAKVTENDITNSDLQINLSYPDFEEENFIKSSPKTDCMFGRILTEKGVYSCPFLAGDYRGRAGSTFQNFSKNISAETEFCATCSKNKKPIFTIG